MYAIRSYYALPGLNLAVYSREASIRDMRFAYPEGAGSGYSVLMFSVDDA